MGGPRLSLVVCAATVSLLLGLSACGSDDSPLSGHSPSASSASPDVTAPGSQKGLQEPAVVNWSPKAGVSGRLAISVDELQTTSFKSSFGGWKLDKDMLSRSPYFVRATVRNAGKTDLGGYNVPLWGLDAENNLVEPAEFTQAFKPCEPKKLPVPFPPGQSVKVCLVMLVPNQGRLEGVSFRPDEDYQPITWKGTLTAYVPSPSSAPKPPAASPSSPSTASS